jgi:hypothetical protein
MMFHTSSPWGRGAQETFQQPTSFGADKRGWVSFFSVEIKNGTLEKVPVDCVLNQPFHLLVLRTLLLGLHHSAMRWEEIQVSEYYLLLQTYFSFRSL